MSLFKEYIIEPVKYGLNNPNNGIPIPLAKLSKVINFIERGQYVAIGGKPTSGKSSFMDFVYMINVYKWWRELDEGNRPQLKMFYFNMKTTPKIKWQKWICLYLKLEYNLVIDIPTLTGGIGKLYDLDDDIIQKIESAKDFFEDFEEDVITMINGQQQPSSIFNKVKDYMEDCGHIDTSGKYNLDEDNLGQYTFVYVDNADRLLPESDGFQQMNEGALKKKLNEYLYTLTTTYNVNAVVIVPSRVIASRMVKDSEPSYKELGLFGKTVDLGLISYNPYNENNNNYLGYPIEDTVINGKTRFRTLTVVRNSRGLENITVGNFFLGECGYFAESPHPLQEDDFDNILQMLSQLP